MENKQEKEWNILMITLDGLRADRLNLCPNLKSFSKEGIKLTEIITAAPYTLASMYSIFSGIYPSKNGVNAYYNMFKFKKNQIKTLPEYFKERRYFTFAQVLSDSVIPKKGFENVEIHHMKENQIEMHKKMILEGSKKGKFFLYFQYTGIHDGTIKRAKEFKGDQDKNYFSEEGRENNKRINCSLIKECDNYVQKIINYLKKLNILKNTLVIFHSDHGVSEGEVKGENLYGSYLYDYTLKTFCIMLFPEKIKKSVNLQCRTIDIMPTILEGFNIKLDKNFENLQGESLFPIINGEEKEERIAFSETGGLFGPWPSPKEPNVFCIRYKDKKIIYNKTPKTWEFYNLKKDPEEKENLINKNIQEIKEYKKILLEKMKENEMVF